MGEILHLHDALTTGKVQADAWGIAGLEDVLCALYFDFCVICY
jgi:hypothetical protein